MLRLFWRKSEAPPDEPEPEAVDADTAALYKLAYEFSLRSLNQQESVLNELRTRTGTLLAASSLAASFLGARAAAEHRVTWIGVLGLAAFIGSVWQSATILLPNDDLIFAVSGTVLVEQEFGVPGGLPELHRRLAYWLQGYREANQPTINTMFRAFRIATGAVLAEVIIWTGQLLLS